MPDDRTPQDVDAAVERAATAVWNLGLNVLAGKLTRDDRLESIAGLADTDGLEFATCLAVSAGQLFARNAPCDACGQTGCGNHTVTIDVTDDDGNLVSIDQVSEPTRTAWRAILAGANGDSPVPFLISVTSPDQATDLAATLVELFQIAVQLADDRTPKQ